jgi:hypothetical protein
MKMVYVHVHLAKNGGETFNSILRRYFGRGYCRFPEASPGYVATAEEKRVFLAERPQARCVSGHAFRYPGPAEDGLEYRYLAFLRHPVERLISLYAYEQKRSPAEHSSHRPIEEWIERRLAEDNALTNYQAFHVIGERDAAGVSFERARQVLDSFFFVGITELYDRSLLLLAKQMGITLYDVYYQKKNATDSKERFPVSEETWQRLLAMNEVDMGLYEYGRGRLERELEQMGAAKLLAQEQELGRIRQLVPAVFPWWVRVRGRVRTFTGR